MLEKEYDDISGWAFNYNLNGLKSGLISMEAKGDYYDDSMEFNYLLFHMKTCCFEI